MKKVLILSASPRKGGNSDTLCDRFAQGATERGHKVEKVFLASQNIGYCRGCGVCNSTHKCVQRDDMAEILDKMVEADVIVLATPVYFYSMDGQMKTFIDRTVPRMVQEKLVLFMAQVHGKWEKFSPHLRMKKPMKWEGAFEYGICNIE